MAFRVRGYGRASTEKQILSTAQQRKNVEDAFDLYKRVRPDWAGAEWAGWFEDIDVSRTTKFRERENGHKVWTLSESGDVIMASNYDRLFARPLDVYETLEEVRTRGIRLCILDFPIPIDDRLGEACFMIISMVKNLEVQATRDRTRKALAHRKDIGLPHSGKSPPGWKTVVCMVDGQRRKFFTKNWAARELGAMILAKLRETGLDISNFQRWCVSKSWNDHNGNPWSVSSLRRFIAAAEAGFPLPNGKLEAMKIPPEAKIVESFEV